MSTSKTITTANANNRFSLGSRSRAVVRAAARIINPVSNLAAGRRWMPILGVLHHVGRRSGKVYDTPLGMRPLGDSFIMPRTFGENAAWYLNVVAAGWCQVTYLGRTYTLVDPEIIEYAAASAAFPRYELAQFRLIGINEFLRLRIAPAGWARPSAGR